MPNETLLPKKNDEANPDDFGFVRSPVILLAKQKKTAETCSLYAMALLSPAFRMVFLPTTKVSVTRSRRLVCRILLHHKRQCPVAERVNHSI